MGYSLAPPPPWTAVDTEALIQAFWGCRDELADQCVDMHNGVNAIA